VRKNVLAGTLFHTAWATDLADEDTPRETRAEIKTSATLTWIPRDAETGQQGGSDGCQVQRMSSSSSFYLAVLVMIGYSVSQPSNAHE